MLEGGLKFVSAKRPRPGGKFAVSLVLGEEVKFACKVDPHSAEDRQAFLDGAKAAMPGLNGETQNIEQQLLQLAVQRKKKPQAAPAGHEAGESPTPYVLVPGTHDTPDGKRVERGADAFTNEVLDRLPVETIYRRGGVPGSITGDPGSRAFAELQNDGMRILVDGNMRLAQARILSRGESEQFVMTYKPASRDHAGLIIARASADPRVPELKYIGSYPIFRPGYRLSPPGFGDGVYYDEPEELKGLEAETDHEVIRQTLDDLIIDFPFRDEASRQNYVGLLVTIAIRSVVGGNIPGHLIHATLERTGKTKLAEIPGMIFTGKKTPAMQIGQSNEEMDKRITAILLRGDTLMHLDNLKDEVDLPCLASLLTASVYQGRLLGSSKIVEIQNNTTIIATGNNVKTSGEIAKRMVPICLQAKTDSPELRTDFNHPDLWGYVRQQRRLILACLIGMVQEWARAGCPAGKRPMGGFDEWAAIVGGILNHFGYVDWMTNAGEWRDEADTNRSDLRAMVDEWIRFNGGSPLKVSDILAIAVRLELFPAITGNKEGRALETSFGMRVLSKHLNTPIDKWTIHKNSLSRPAIYALRLLAESGEG